MKKICLLCGKSHGKSGRPRECQFKGAILGSLFQHLVPHEAMFICDRTSFLSDAWKRFNRTARSKK